MILVTGATGNIGRRVAEGLALEGRPVRALVRDPAAVEAFEAMGVNALVGDITRVEDRAAALVGVHEVLCCHAAEPGADAEAVLAVDGAATVALIEQAREVGVKTFVLLSHLGLDRCNGSARFEAKRQAEAALVRADGMRYVILRVAPLMTALCNLPMSHNPGESGSFLIFGRGETRLSPVAPGDVATIVRRCTKLPAALGHVVELGGPETYTWNELPALFERVYRTSLAVWRLPLWVLSLARTIFGWFNATWADRLRYYEALYSVDLAADPAPVFAMFGVELTDFESYLIDEGEAVAPPEIDIPLDDGEADRAPTRAVETARPTTPLLDDDLPEPPTREPEAAPTAEPEIDHPDEPEPRLELTPPPAPPTAELPDPPTGIDWIDPPREEAAADGDWGHRVEFGAEPPSPADEPPAKRPPVRRPERAEQPVVDHDPPGAEPGS